MTKEGDVFTLWNNPMEHWTKILEETTVTREMLQETTQTRQLVDSQALEERLKPFQTPITESTMSQLVN
jgi:hypothetical protein